MECRRWVRPRKRVNLGAETICGGCMAALSPGWTWTVGGAMSVLVCEDCAMRCSKCRPVDTRLQWGDDTYRFGDFLERGNPDLRTEMAEAEPRGSRLVGRSRRRDDQLRHAAAIGEGSSHPLV